MASVMLPRRRFALGACSGLAALAAHAQPEPLLSRRLFFSDPERLALRISPLGNQLAWVAPVDGVRNLWVASSDDPAGARPVTRIRARPISTFFVWAWTERHIVFFEDRDGDENWRASSVDIDSGELVALTPPNGVNAQFAARDPRRPHEMALAHNGRDRRFADLYRVDLRRGDATRLFENREFDSVVVDRDFAVRFARRVRGDGGADLLERRGEGWDRLADVPLEDMATTRLVDLSVDGRSLYLLDSRGRDKAALFEIDVATRASRLLAEDSEADITTVVMEPATGRPLYAVSNADRARIHPVDPDFAPHLARLRAHAGDADLHLPSIAERGGRMIMCLERDAASDEFGVYDRTRGTLRSLFKARPRLADVELRAMRPLTIVARDGLALTSYLTEPRADRAVGAMVLYVHGGPYSRDVWGYSPIHQWLTSRGYAVLSVNFRGSTGFGKAFVNAADGEWGRRMHDDLVDGVEWAIARGVTDRARVAIYGVSYGGYAALTGLTQTPELFACGISLVGISNLRSFMATIPPYWEAWFAIWKRRLADPVTEAGRAWLEERSPLTHVDRIRRPLLIGHGANDMRVKVAESEQIVAAMRARSLPVTYALFPDEGHGLARPANRMAFYALLENFLARHLGGRAEPIGDAVVRSSVRIAAGGELIQGAN